MELLSPVLAGVMLVRTSTATAFLFNAASFLFPAAAMFLVQLVEPLVALVLSAFDGIVYTYATTLFQTRIQEEAPPQERGRIFGVVAAYEEVVTVSGQLAGGGLASAVGILAGIRLSAGFTVVLVLMLLAVGVRALHRRAAPRAELPR